MWGLISLIGNLTQEKENSDFKPPLRLWLNCSRLQVSRVQFSKPSRSQAPQVRGAQVQCQAHGCSRPDRKGDKPHIGVMPAALRPIGMWRLWAELICLHIPMGQPPCLQAPSYCRLEPEAWRWGSIRPLSASHPGLNLLLVIGLRCLVLGSCPRAHQRPTGKSSGQLPSTLTRVHLLHYICFSIMYRSYYISKLINSLIN